jgi:hypothetical protein
MTNLSDVRIATTARAQELRELVDVSVSAPDRDDRDAAKAKLSGLAASYRGFPGQRRRGDLPSGVEIR